MLTKQLSERLDKKKRSKCGKKKHTPTPLESSEEEEDLDHIEVSSKHSDCSNIGKTSAQKVAEFEKCSEAMANRGKLLEAGHD